MHPSASLYMGKPLYVVFFLPLLLVPALLLFLKFMSTFPQVRIFGSCDIVTDYVAFFPPQLFPTYKIRNFKGLLKFKRLLPLCNTKGFRAKLLTNL